ncbi:MAG TPA: DoxX family protein [Puia sp.]|jgi:putative oxidoreductase|nr:DoxX family protein [Puia sp.]
MHFTDKIKKWGDLHHPKILDVIRMSLGVFLFVKGYIFFNDAAYLRDMIIENRAIRQSPQIISAIIYYVTYIHLVGGALIFFGLYTRFWALLQLPIVFGAVFFVNILSPFVNVELWVSILVLVLLFLFTVIGSGPLSLDHLLFRINANEKERL